MSRLAGGSLASVIGSGLLALGLWIAAAATFASSVAPLPASPSGAPVAVLASPLPTPAARPTQRASQQGRTLFQIKGCIGCHSIVAKGLQSPTSIAPDLSSLPQTAATRRPGVSAQAYVRESVRQPQAYLVPGYVDVQMPTLPVSDVELDELIAFLLSPDQA
jgi:cytochrome c oxidase subunit 2